MKFTLTIDMDNAAFEDPKYELRRIFKALVVGDRLRDLDVTDDRIGAREGPIHDHNGNRCGRWEITE